MLRRTLAALLLSSLALSARADDPGLPTIPGPTLGPTPIAEPTPIRGSTTIHSGTVSVPPNSSGTYSGTYQSEQVYSQSSPSYGVSGGTVNSYHNSVESAPAYETPSYGSSVEYGTHSFGQPMDLGYAPPATTGCACQSGISTLSGGSAPLMMTGDVSFGVADNVGGYQAMGYHGGGMETYTGATGGGLHVRHPYYSYRRPWYANGPMSQNVSIAW